MRICSLASGSSGNCIYIGSDSTHLLIDAGLSCKKTIEDLKAIGLDISDIDGILITHEHIDHVRGLGVISRKYGIDIYSNNRTRSAFQNDERLGKLPSGIFKDFVTGGEFRIGDITVRAFNTEHDAAEPVGYVLENSGKTVAAATDLGCITDTLLDNLSGRDVVFIEANHDVRMLEAGAYPYRLKKRIMGEKGHLSNDDAGRVLSDVLHDDLKKIMLGHLSEENNYPRLAYETVCAEVTFGDNPYKAGDFPIEVTGRDRMSELFEW